MAVERICEDRKRTIVLTVNGALFVAIALVDWWIKPYLSLGLPSRLLLETLAFTSCGLFVAELIRNRKLIAATEAKLNALVETTPAAILTIDEHGFIELANHSAVRLMEPRNGKLTGSPIAEFLPELHYVVREKATRFRTSLLCQARRGSDDSFIARIWLSTYQQGAVLKVAVIIGEAEEEVNLSPRTCVEGTRRRYREDSPTAIRAGIQCRIAPCIAPDNDRLSSAARRMVSAHRQPA